MRGVSRVKERADDGSYPELSSPSRMRRADRLFRLVQLLRRSRVTTARRLAAELEVSERTVYRDVSDLSASGVPIEGEAGVGYRLRDFDLPPLMFTVEEIEALVLGARMVENWTDPELASAARDALFKVEAALPKGKKRLVGETRLFVPSREDRGPEMPDFAVLRRAIREGRKIRFAYTDTQGRQTRRTVRPLSLAFFGPVWVMAAWCELRDDFRAFRPDRIAELRVLDPFVPQAGKTWRDYMLEMGIDPDA